MKTTSKLHGLYVITDSALTPWPAMTEQVAAALRGGARIVQYRDKSDNGQQRLLEARALRRLCHDHNALLIINDDIELALAVDADGVHLGRDDGDIATARQRLSGRILGITCYNEWQRAETAAAAGADYIAFGAFFPSSTKPNAVAATVSLLQRAKQGLNLPVVAIGGIKPDNGARLIKEGADMLAVVHGVFGKTNIQQAATEYARLFK